MQKYYNAAQAARYIGVDDKTVRRWLKDGKITATRTSSNQLAIEASEVERIKRERDAEQAKFVSRPTMPSPPNHAQVEVDTLGERVADLERKVAELEQQLLTMSRNAHVSPEMPRQASVVPTTTPPPTKPSRPRTTAKRGTLPDGCILASEFAKQHGIPRETMRDYLLLGVGFGTVPGKEIHPTIPVKDAMEYSERPKPGREHTGEKERYFTPEQQKDALALLRKHGKLPEG